MAWSVAIIIVSMLSFDSINCLPQCLDFQPPFENPNLGFCSKYAKFGCCTATRDEEIKEKFEMIRSGQEMMKNIHSQDIEVCEEYLQMILCQECSPYAAKIFALGEGEFPAPFPGICPIYCSDFYGKCNKIIPLVTDNAHLNEAFPTEEDFCSSIALMTDEDYCFPELESNPMLTEALSEDAWTKEGCSCLEPFAPDTKLRSPIALWSSPDDTGRIFISELEGTVHIFDENRVKNPEPFLDLSEIDIHANAELKYGERGFLNMVFHPEFAHNGKVYALFHVSDDERNVKVRISEFQVDNANPDRVNRTSERIILEIDEPYTDHNGGEMLFGSDGYLYIFTDDGGGRGDPLQTAQNKLVLLGKTLRLDINTGDDSIPYNVPSDNPFVGVPAVRPEIFAHGLRNPWGCSVDAGNQETGYGAGRIFCGDVGQVYREEINLIQSGGNYGWSSHEGHQCYNNDTCGLVGAEVYPIFEYNHTVGQHVTGGVMYRGCRNPNLRGLYFYGDYETGKLFRLHEEKHAILTGISAWTNKEVQMCDKDVCTNGLTNEFGKKIVSFGQDKDGELYILTADYLQPSNPNGKVFKLVDPRRRGNPENCKLQTVFTTATGTTPTTPRSTTTTPADIQDNGCHSVASIHWFTMMAVLRVAIQYLCI